MFAPTEQAQRIFQTALGPHLHWEGSDECLREKGRATPLVLEQEGLGERAVPPVDGGNLEEGGLLPHPDPPRQRLTARQFFEPVPEISPYLGGQTRGSAPAGKAVE